MTTEVDSARENPLLGTEKSTAVTKHRPKQNNDVQHRMCSGSAGTTTHGCSDSFWNS